MKIDRQPHAWCYARGSHDEQYAKRAVGVDICNTVDRQIEACKAYYDLHLAKLGIAWGGVEAETIAVSAAKTPFLKRPAAVNLMAKMQPGDHILFDKVDRMWRRVKDFVHIDEVFTKGRITMHIVNLMGASISRGTAMGDFILNVMVCIAQLESQVISDRIKANNAWRRERGLPLNHKQYGKKLKGPKSKRYFVDDPVVRAIGQEIVRLRDGEGLSFEVISDRLEIARCEQEGRTYYPPRFAASRRDGTRRRWTLGRVQRAYESEKRMIESSQG
jgi:DNA invertase Pin-like site-specific DNA recombinase